MRKKTLIYMEEFYLKPTGGPAGYLYNLKKELERKKILDIDFIKKPDKYEGVKKTTKRLPNRLTKFLQVCKRTAEINSLLSSKPKVASINLEDYDLVHFHNTRKLFKVKDSLNTYSGRVLLQSHSPKPPFLETLQDSITPIERKIFKKKYLRMSAIDKYAFERADYIICPCPEAEEPYFNNWEDYAELKERNKDKYRYLITGINPCSAKINCTEVREKYNIPQDAFVISYVGRHNETKGYDMLKKIGEKVLSKENDIYFLIAGKEEPLKGLDNNNWIEVGWTNDPHSLIAASDVFVLPNKETYFDIVMLEVLSLGKIVIASNTGGNKYFEKIGAEGVFLYDSIDDALRLINKVKTLQGFEKTILEKSNKDLFDERFTSEIFVNNYLKLLNDLRK